MTETNLWLLIAVVALVLFGLYAWGKWLRVMNSPDGERYARNRAQGSWVPGDPDR